MKKKHQHNIKKDLGNNNNICMQHLLIAETANFGSNGTLICLLLNLQHLKYIKAVVSIGGHKDDQK